METKKSIINAIESRVENSQGSKYSVWRIGLTHDPVERKIYWDNPKYWKQWEADSLSDAEEIESYFINVKGMKGGTGGDLSSRKTVYVYIF